MVDVRVECRSLRGFTALLFFVISLPVLAQTRLNFPRVVNTPSERTGIAIANLSTAVANLTFRAYDQQGQLITGPGITNPATRTLAGSRQLAEVAFQIFGDAFNTTSAWVEVESDNSQIVGFFLFFDDAVSFLDGADAGSQTTTEMIFTETASMELSLANSSTTSADVSLSLSSDAGQLLSSQSIQIPGRGRFSASLSSLFPSLAEEFLSRSRQLAANSSLLVNSNRGLLGFGLLGDRTRFIAALNGQPTSEGATQLYVPQYVEDENFSTELNVVNLEAATASVTLQLVGPNGLQLGSTAQRSIPGRGRVVINDPAAFGRPRSGPRTEGYVVVTSSGPRLAGSVIFGDPARTTFLTALPFVSRPQRDVVYSQVAQNDLFFTGAAIINLSSQPSSSTIEVFNTDGQLINSGTRPLPGRGRDSFVLTEMFPALRINAGYFRVRSTQDIATFAVFGTHTLSALSAVPPQIPP